MKTNFNKVLSFVCILTMLMSCIPSASVFSSGELSIITAQFVPYDQEIRVLADIPEGYTARVYVSDTEISCDSTVTSDGTLLTSMSYTPSVYGIVPLKLEATNGISTLSETQNIKIVKAFDKGITYSEDFNSLDVMVMSDAADTTVVEAIEALNTEFIVTNLPSSSAGRYIDLTKDFTADGSVAPAFRFEGTVASGLPAFTINPESDPTTGIIELSYDFMTTNTEIRQTINPTSRAYTSGFKFTTNDGEIFNTSFQAVHYSDHCFGSTDVKVKANIWYNIRFLMNLNELTFEFYVNDVLMNYGTFSYLKTSYVANYIYGINKFDLAAGTQGTAGASKDKPAYVAFDNMNLSFVDTGAAPYAISYIINDEETQASLLNAEIPFNADSIKVDFSHAIEYADGDITLKTLSGSEIEATIEYADGMPYASSKNRSSFIITPVDGFNIGQTYKLTVSPDATYDSTSYGLNNEIYFKATGMLSVLSPSEGASVNAGETIELSACTPDAEFVDLYINGVYISTLTPDANDCVSYLYNTQNASLGNKSIKYVISKEDYTTEEINSSFEVVKDFDTDIIALETFESVVDSEYFSVVKQACANSAAMVQTEIDGQNAAAFYFNSNGKTASSRKVIQVQKSISQAQEGRVCLEFDLYLDDANKNAELSISFGDGTYTFYPMDIVKVFSKGTIAGETIAYNGWHKVKLVMDTVDQSSQLYFDDNQVGETCYTIANTYHKTTVPEPEELTNFKAFTFSLFQGYTGTSGETYLGFAIDNWHLYKEMPMPVISSVTAYDSSANSSALEDNGLVSNNVKSFELNIPESIYTDNASFIQNFKVIADEIELNAENIVLSDGTLSFDISSLPENADLEFLIGKDTLMYDGATSIGTDVIFALKVADDNGLYAKRYITITNGKAKAVFKTDSYVTNSVILIIATYNDDVLTGITSTPVDASVADITTLTLPTSGSTHAKAFIWGSMDTAFPVSAGEIKVNVNTQN